MKYKEITNRLPKEGDTVYVHRVGLLKVSMIKNRTMVRVEHEGNTFYLPQSMYKLVEV